MSNDATLRLKAMADRLDQIAHQHAILARDAPDSPQDVLVGALNELAEAIRDEAAAARRMAVV